MDTVKDLLSRKEPKPVASIKADEPVQAAAQLMNERRIGSLVVTEGEHVVGIFSERDILRRVVAELKDPKATKVGDVMTSPCIVVSPTETVEHCRAIMTQKRVRHLPVVDSGRLVGIITQGDIMAHVNRDNEVQIEYLQRYLYGP